MQSISQAEMSPKRSFKLLKTCKKDQFYAAAKFETL